MAASLGLAAVCAVAAVSARADTYNVLTGSDIVGEVAFVEARYEDTLTDIARIHGLGYEEIVWANEGVDVWLPNEGTAVRLPKQFILPAANTSGIVVNIAEYRLYHYSGRGNQRTVSTFPISIGRMDWATPIGRWAVASKQKDPAWYPPESIRQEHLKDGRGFLPRVVPPGPDNPLGRYAMRLSVSSYLIHGTNRPVGVGMQVTHGCIRMYPEDIEWLYPRVPVSTPVRIMNQPYKFGWAGDELYVEVHPPLEGDTAAGEQGMTALLEQYVMATGDRQVRVNWDVLEQAFERRDGVPVRVGNAVPPQAAVSADVGDGA